MATLDDDLFIDELVCNEVDRLVEEANSRISSTQPPPPHPKSTTATTITTVTGGSSMPYPPALQRPSSTRTSWYRERSVSTNRFSDGSFSPPRELSQRPMDTDDVPSPPPLKRFIDPKPREESENERLKKELARVSKQLTGLEQECLELKREKDKKERQLQSLFSRVGTSDAECNDTRNGTLEGGVLVPENPGNSLNLQNQNILSGHISSWIKNAHKTIGIQTDVDGDCASSTLEGDDDLPRRLLPIWSSSSSLTSGRNFITKLLETCGSDFCALFGFLGMNMTSQMMDLTKIQHSSHVTPLSNPCQHSSETGEVSNLYSVLIKTPDEEQPFVCSSSSAYIPFPQSPKRSHTKHLQVWPVNKSSSQYMQIRNDAVPMKALLEVLLDLCSLHNVDVVHRSLHILHVVLDLLLAMDKMCSRRDNVKVEGLLHEKDHFVFEKEKVGGIGDASKEGASSSGLPPVFNINCAAFLDDNKLCDLGNAAIISHADSVRVFKTMLHIATTRWGEVHVQVQAVVIMSTIIRRSNAYTEREMFGDTLVFEAVGELLKKGVSSCLQTEAVHLLYLLFNCPKLLATFCSGSEDGNSIGAPNGDPSSSVCVSSLILDGLAMCISRSSKSAQDLLLCRKVIVALAFLGSSGKSGFEILLFQKLPSRANFLGLILQVLASEADAEASENCTLPEISKERTLLMREALILFNRLASHPTYSTTVLQLLTSRGDMVSLSIDVATRLSKKSRRLWKCDNITKQMRESEVVNLARVFMKRIFVFLGESI